jgi:hypothetical protein
VVTERTICPHCGSGDVEALIPPRAGDDDVFATVPTAQRHCLVCGVRWETDDIDLGERTAG